MGTHSLYLLPPPIGMGVVLGGFEVEGEGEGGEEPVPPMEVALTVAVPAGDEEGRAVVAEEAEIVPAPPISPPREDGVSFNEGEGTKDRVEKKEEVGWEVKVGPPPPLPSPEGVPASIVEEGEPAVEVGEGREDPEPPPPSPPAPAPAAAAAPRAEKEGLEEAEGEGLASLDFAGNFEVDTEGEERDVTVSPPPPIPPTPPQDPVEVREARRAGEE